jgi:hypothetical protein
MDVHRALSGGWRAIGLSLPISGSFQIRDETVGIIEDEQIRGFSGELRHERTGPCSCGQIDPNDPNDPVVLNLCNGLDVCAPEMSA